MVLFMGLYDSDEEGAEEEYEEEEVDLHRRTVECHKIIKKENKKNKSLQEELKRKEETQNSNSK
jgi:hypothetical protein